MSALISAAPLLPVKTILCGLYLSRNYCIVVSGARATSVKCTNAMFDCVRQLCGGKLPFLGDAPNADNTVFRGFDAPDMWRALSISEFTLTTRFEWRVIGITPRMCSGSGRLENFWDTFECCILR